MVAEKATLLPSCPESIWSFSLNTSPFHFCVAFQSRLPIYLIFRNGLTKLTEYSNFINSTNLAKITYKAKTKCFRGACYVL